MQKDEEKIIERITFDCAFYAYNVGLRTAMDAAGSDLDRDKVSDGAWEILRQVATGEITLMDNPNESPSNPDRLSREELRSLTDLQKAVAQAIFKGTARFAEDIGVDADEIIAQEFGRKSVDEESI